MTHAPDALPPISPEKRAMLEQELEYLISIRRAEADKAAREALELGDPDDNAEYSAAMADKAATERRIQELDSILRRARIADDSARR